MDNIRYSKLNAQQLACVVNDDKHILVVAGAGSGKTTVLVNKILFYIYDKQIALDSIMAITFTNKAAFEIKERCNSCVKGLNFSKTYLGTFHSVCLRILRRYYSLLQIDPNFIVIDANDQKRIMSNLIKEALAQDENFLYERKEADLIIGYINLVKEHKLSPEQLAQDFNTYSYKFDFLCQEFIMLYQQYENMKNQANLYDFTDLILKVVLFLQNNSVFKQSLKNYIKAVLVDEFQDINLLQAEFINAIVDDNSYFFAVGDDDQAIYGFRGADVNYMLSLEQYYQNLALYKLDINYRSSQNILDVANALIINNSVRLVDKHLHNKDNSYLQKVQFVKCTNEYDECYAICSIIDRVKALHESLSSVAILYRNNYLSAKIEASLRDYNIDYEVVGGQNFFDREEIKNTIAYFRLAINYDDNVAFDRVCNVPKRSIGKVSLSQLNLQAKNANLSCYAYLQEIKAKLEKNEVVEKNQKNLYSKFKSFIETIDRLQKAAANCDNLVEFMSTVLDETQILEYYKEVDAKEIKNSVSSREDNILELKRFLDNSDRHYDYFDEQQKNLEGSRIFYFLSNSSLLSSSDTLLPQDSNDTDKVKLMTIHASKGLEFKTVIIVDVNEDILPSLRALEDRNNNYNALDEERRLAYVAITRAQLRLYAMYLQNRRNYTGESYKCYASSFLYEITDKFKASDLNKEDYPYKIVQSQTLSVEADDEL